MRTRVISTLYVSDGASHAVHGNHRVVHGEVRVHAHETILTTEKQWVHCEVCAEAEEIGQYRSYNKVTADGSIQAGEIKASVGVG